jgi:leucyl aminopeptidase
MPLNFYTTQTTEKAIPITPVIFKQFDAWLKQQDQTIKNWLTNDVFKAEVSTRCLIKNNAGEIERVLLGIDNENDFWSFASLPRCLPTGTYKIDDNFSADILNRAALGWGLGHYQFSAYKKPIPITAKLQLSKDYDAALLENFIPAIFLVRDLINTPTDDMGPAELAGAVETVAKKFGAQCNQIIGDDLLKENYPTIHAVGRASIHAPRLIDMRWGNPQHRKVTLVGKGVCFDSGGLDIKPADGMLLMKKDMAGAAHALGLAQIIMTAQLPIYLRLLIPAVENAISSNAYHPGDVIKTRKGITVEITNTDAEGRLVLCDALAEANNDKPDVLIDFATLTGAASIALGPQIPSLFSPNEKLAQALLQSSQQNVDPMWRMPLHKPYRCYLDSLIADIANSSPNRFAGSVTAALFLQEFVDPSIAWAHFDFMAWNPDTKHGGRHQGAEAMTLRAVYAYLASYTN